MSSSQVYPNSQGVYFSLYNSFSLYISIILSNVFFSEKCDLRNLTVLVNLPGKLFKINQKQITFFFFLFSFFPAREDVFRVYGTQLGQRIKVVRQLVVCHFLQLSHPLKPAKLPVCLAFFTLLFIIFLQSKLFSFHFACSINPAGFYMLGW